MQNTKRIPESRKCREPAKYEYKKSSYAGMFEVLESLRQDEVFCDIKLKTDDKKIIFAHKVVLESASPYFHAMFIHFSERNHDVVVIKQLDSTALQVIVNFIYTGVIVITAENVRILLAAANLLQLQEVKEECCNFLQSQLWPKNCIGINKLADLHSCTKLLRSSELYIHKNFSEVVDGDEFLSLSSEEVIKLISSDKLIVPSEEKVFESVIRWVKHELGSRKCILTQLMEHVRLPLTSKDYIFKKVFNEPLINNCLKSKDYIIEALYCHLLKSDELIPQNIRTKRRLGDKVILVVGGESMNEILINRTEWYDPKKNQWNFGSDMITNRHKTGLAVVKDNLVFSVGGSNGLGKLLRSVYVLDLSSQSPCWKPSVDMLEGREGPGVGVINDNLYAVGGLSCSEGPSNSAEFFDYNTQKWHMISRMSTRRVKFGVGVLNNLLYAVGGYDYESSQGLDSVECYNPSHDTWTPVAEMCVPRCDVGVGVLDGVLYAVGGHDDFQVQSSVETYSPSTGIWTPIADMHLCRENPSVVALDGLLYVVGGSDGLHHLDSVERYNPNTNTWTMVTASLNFARTLAGVVAIDRPRHFETCENS